MIRVSQDHKSGTMRSAQVHNHLKLLGVCFLLFLSTALGITYRSWSYPWFLDDLHQIRTFSPAELTSVFTGEWDIDKIETPAYRPLTVVFRHLTALAFDESVIAHHLFSLFIMAVYALLLAFIGLQLGMSSWQVALAGILLIISKNNWWNLLYISRGAPMIQSVFLLLSVCTLLMYRHHSRIWVPSLAMLFATVAIFVHETSISLYPLIPGIFILATMRDWYLEETQAKGPESIRFTNLTAVVAGFFIAKRTYFLMAAVVYLWLLGMVIALFILRTLFIPEAGQLLGTPDPLGIPKLVYRALFLMGELPGLESAIWLFGLGILVVSMLALRGWSAILAVMLLGCLAIAAAHGMVHRRPDLLLFPTSFFVLWLVYVLGQQMNVSRWRAGMGVAAFMVIIVTSANQSMIAQEAIHPRSLEYLAFTRPFLWGSYSTTIMPQGRVEQLKAEFAKVDLSDDLSQRYILAVEQAFFLPGFQIRGDRVALTPDQLQQLYLEYQSIVEEARKQRRAEPSDDGEVFVPRISLTRW